MMKNISFLILFFLTVRLFSQCEVNTLQGPMIADPAESYSCQILNGDFITDQSLFNTDSMDRTALPNAIVGQLYSTSVGLRIPTDSSFVYELTPGDPQLFENVAIVSIGINSVEGIPMGFSWECVGGPETPTDCTWSGGDYGCIRFFSEGSVDAGLSGSGMQAYPLNVLLDVSAIYYIFSVPVPIELTIEDLLNYYVLVIEEDNTSSSGDILDAKQFGHLGNFPNPAGDYFTVQYGNDKPSKIDFKLYDILGNLVAFEVYHSTIGYNEITFDSTKLISGIYTYTLSNNLELITEHIIIK